MSEVSPAANCPPGSSYPLLPGVQSRMIATPRLRQHVYESAAPHGERVLLVHGNASSARWFELLIASLPDYSVVAPDLRGYGASEAKPADAQRGLRDFSDDLEALVAQLGWERFHLLGWSLGGPIVMQYTLDHPERVASLTLHATGSPYGYGGTHGAEGTPNEDDYAGSGGGLIAPAVIERYEAHDMTADSPFSPRSALRQLLVKPGFAFAPEREDALVEQMLMMVIGDQYYPGDGAPSPNWPFSAPGVWGANNALSPKYCDLSALARVAPQPPILWARGDADAMVSDTAAVDPAALGKLDVIPGWPGDERCPPQPMLQQIRHMLDEYRANGGAYEERVLADCGHSPLLEKPDEFLVVFRAFLQAHPLGVSGAPTQTATSEAAPPTSAQLPEQSQQGQQGQQGQQSQQSQRAGRGPLGWLRRRS